MSDGRCPRCRSGATSPYVAIVCSIEAWPLIMLSACVVYMAGRILSFSHMPSVVFVLCAVIPLCTRVVRKSSCARCGIDFQSGTTGTSVENHPRADQSEPV